MIPISDRITDKKTLNEWLKYELEQYGGCKYLPDFLQIGEKGVLRFHQKLLRNTEYYFNTNQKLFYYISMFFLRRIQIKYSLRIPINTCSKGLHIMHVAPVAVNRKAVIGKNCVIHSLVTVGAGGNNDFAPVIGDNVILAVNSTVLGKVTIPDNVVVGACSLVIKDILEDNITVAGVPAKKISNIGSNGWAQENRKNNV